MKKKIQRLLCWRLLFVLMMGCTVSVQAASYMNDKSIKFDLKAGKTFTFYNTFSGLGTVKETGKITSFSVENYKEKKGYKIATLNVTFNDDYKLTSSEVKKIMHSAFFKKSGEVGDMFNVYVVNYQNGKVFSSSYKKYDRKKYSSFETFYSKLYANYDGYNEKWVDQDPSGKVKVIYYPWKSLKVMRHKDNDGCCIWLEKISRKVSIIYPANYKGICIGVGGNSQPYETLRDKKFDVGLLPFKMTSYYSRKKPFYRFLKVS